ncbi:uncharacterized protein [Oryza sativa Japonica Group]|uniref:uncharacterized protein isoform X2 n=2 Tax=Oryza sativa subsp. japonica TaxID=39947 RepID=UPI00339D1000
MRYCAKFIPNQNHPFPIRIVMLSALSKHNPTIDAGQYPQGPYMQYSLIDSFLAYEQKGLRADTLSAAKVGSGGRAMGAPEGGAGARAAMFPASA